jgi:hypothetical protein
MIDERAFWSLGGPAGFVREVVERVGAEGAVAVRVPGYHPPGLADALSAGFEEAGLVPLHRVRSDARGSAVHRMATAAGVTGGGMRTVGAFFDQPALRGSVFMVDATKLSDWATWGPFLRSFGSERRRRRDELLMPGLVALVPTDAAPADVERVFQGAEVRWEGRVSSFDVRTYVSGRLGKASDSSLADRVAREVAIALAGYDPVLAHALCAMDTATAIDPWDALRAQYGAAADTHPHWGNGLVDTVDGDVFVHTASLIAAGDRRAFDLRRWRAVSGPVLDFNAKACRHFADTHAAELDRHLPYSAATNFLTKTVTDRHGLENKHIRDCLGPKLPYDDQQFLKGAARARNEVAHNVVPETSLLTKLSAAWERYGADLSGSRGWDWPRCGQTLVLTVGPRGGGKSTHVEATYPEADVVRADDLRVARHGSLDGGNHAKDVSDAVAERIVARLSRGDSAVLDGTNLKAGERTKVLNLVPPDLEVVYVVVDRPLADKKRDCGWQRERLGLLEHQTAEFEGELASILAGDGRPNVRVTDLRVGVQGS